MQEEGREDFLTKPRFRVLLSSSGMGRYTARATQLAKMVSKMMVSKGLAPGLRRIPRVISGVCRVEEKRLLKASLQIYYCNAKR